MKILLFGGSGQLGFELRKRAEDLAFEVVSPVTSELNITEDEQVRFLVKRVKPDVVINCAAYTAVDKAEEDQETAYKVNRDGPRYVAEGCRDAGVRFIHLSTDYVFDGSLGRPLREDDPTNPLSAYGRTKLAGEEEVSKVMGERALIVRTSSLHGQKGVNFVHTMVKLMRERDVVRVVSDQIMSPTWAGWLAETLLDLARMQVGGVVHASCQGAISWFDFATEIRRYLEGESKIATLHAIPASELSRPAQRPSYSAFDTSKLAQILGRRPISWQEGLQRHLGEIGISI